jgi:hypothetical protein
MAKGVKGFPKDFMGRLVKVFNYKRGKRWTCSIWMGTAKSQHKQS